MTGLFVSFSFKFEWVLVQVGQPKPSALPMQWCRCDIHCILQGSFVFWRSPRVKSLLGGSTLTCASYLTQNQSGSMKADQAQVWGWNWQITHYIPFPGLICFSLSAPHNHPILPASQPLWHSFWQCHHHHHFLSGTWRAAYPCSHCTSVGATGTWVSFMTCFHSVMVE